MYLQLSVPELDLLDCEILATSRSYPGAWNANIIGLSREDYYIRH